MMGQSEDAGALEEEVTYFEKHQAELRNAHPGQYVLIKGRDVLGSYETFEDAYRHGLEMVGNEPMLIRHVDDEEMVHTVPAMMYRGGHGAS